MDTFKKYSAEIFTLLVFIVYLFTLAPSVVQIDSGELSAVQATLGIAHPTGYPLFTIIGYLFLKIPLPFTKIYQANLLAAIWCTLGIFIFIKSSLLLLKNIPLSTNTNKKTKWKKVQTTETYSDNKLNIIISSISGGLFLAFSKTYWIQSASVEVYSLQIFLFNIIIYLLIKAYFTEDASLKPWLLVAVALAFGFANHMTTLLIFPLIAILFFGKETFSVNSFKKIGLMLALFFPILLLFYIYIPIRAATNPHINWGNVNNFESFWRHFTGRQYQVWLFSSFDSAKKQLAYFVQNLPSEFAYIGLVIIAIGFVHLINRSKMIFYSLLATFLFAVIYSINYDITDIDSYFLLAYIMLAFFAVFGFQKIILWLSQKTDVKFIFASLIIFCAVEVFVNFSEADQHDMHTFEDYTKAILTNADPNSVIFSYTWDYFISPSYYFQYAEGLRKDVSVIDKELLRRSWYYNQMKRNYPEVVKNIQPEINNFLEAIKPFERDENFDSNLLEKYYRSIMTNLIAQNAEKASYYIGLELVGNEIQRGEFSLPHGYKLVPDIFMFKAVKGNNYTPAKDPNFVIRFPKPGNKYTNNIKNFIGSMLSYRAEYELTFNKPERAKIYLDKIRKDLPDFQIPGKLIQQLYGGNQ